MTSLLLKALFGAVIIVVIQLLAQTKNYYVAGLVPLFPTFTLMSHYIVGTQRTSSELKATIRFGISAMIPYLVYMLALYFLVERVKLVPALIAATACWAISATILILVWKGP